MGQNHQRKAAPVIAVTHADIRHTIGWRMTKLGVRYYGGKVLSITPSTYDPNIPFDGIVFLGGSDINPKFYGEAVISDSEYNTMRDEMELELARWTLKQHIPILGICRGMQLLNVAAGGTLYQEVKDVYHDFFPTKGLIAKIFTRRTIFIEQNTRLFSIMGHRMTYKVNSLHHQGVNRVGEGLQISASEESGLIQAIESISGAFALGVQWHPELMLHDKMARSIFTCFMKEASK